MRLSGVIFDANQHGLHSESSPGNTIIFSAACGGCPQEDRHSQRIYIDPKALTC